MVAVHPVRPADSIVRAMTTFLVPALAERMTALVASGTAKSSSKLRNSIWDWRFRTDRSFAFPMSTDGRDEVVRIAREAGIAPTCDVLCTDGALDGRRLPFPELFDAIDGLGGGTFAVLDPDRLAFHQGEDARDTWVLSTIAPRSRRASGGRRRA